MTNIKNIPVTDLSDFICSEKETIKDAINKLNKIKLDFIIVLNKKKR